MKDYSNIHINVSGCELPPLFSRFFTKRLEKLRNSSNYDPTIILQITKMGTSYQGELKMNDLDLSLGCFDQSKDLLELFKGLETEMFHKLASWNLKENYSHIYY